MGIGLRQHQPRLSLLDVEWPCLGVALEGDSQVLFEAAGVRYVRRAGKVGVDVGDALCAPQRMFRRVALLFIQPAFLLAAVVEPHHGDVHRYPVLYPLPVGLGVEDVAALFDPL